MSDKKVFLITGASRGMGVDIARAALIAGHAVVATARKTENIVQALGEHENLLAVKLDITNEADAEATIQATTDRFGRLDVLINNAGSFRAGSSRRSPPTTSGPRSRPTCSARSTSPAPP